MKSLYFLMTALLLSQPVLANNVFLESPVGKCLRQSLPPQMAPRTGNREYFSSWDSQTVAIEKSSATDSKIAYLPRGILTAIEDGTWQTAHGSVNYENRTNTNVSSTMTEDGLQLQVGFRYNNEVNVVLEVPAGIPYLTADRHTEVSCTVDSYGRKICQEPVNTDSNFAVAIPRGYQPHLTLINAQTKLASDYAFDAESFKACLEKLHK